MVIFRAPAAVHALLKKRKVCGVTNRLLTLEFLKAAFKIDALHHDQQASCT